jgi:hypothetical protein
MPQLFFNDLEQNASNLTTAKIYDPYIIFVKPLEKKALDSSGLQ